MVVLVLMVPAVNANPDVVYCDSEDGYVYNTGGAYSNAIYAGDENINYFRGFVKFSLSGISGTLSSATMKLYLYWSCVDGTTYDTSPLPNLGLDDCTVVHIGDYGTLDSSDFNAPSIGNDPGVLLSSTATPDVGYLSIDVKAAMQDDIDNGRSWSAFMIKMDTGSDGDEQEDWWRFAETETSVGDPYIEYTFATRAVGGVLTPVNKLAMLAPYIALLGLVGTVAVIAVALRKCST